jgi:hypothetical protein
LTLIYYTVQYLSDGFAERIVFMRLAHPSESEWSSDEHPTGALAFKYLLEGEEFTPENYVLIVAKNAKKFDMPRHRHYFEQFRYAIEGELNIGDGIRVRQGELGYFPEGTPYGPQDDPAGPLAMVIQFGGGSGQGYLSRNQYNEGHARLSGKGRFDGSVFISQGPDGQEKRTFSIDAIYEEIFGRRPVYPKPRYTDPIIMSPGAFDWVPVAGARGVEAKLLGSFTERIIVAEMFRLDPGARLEFAGGSAIGLGFVIEGQGQLGDRPIGQHSAFEVGPAERSTLAATASTTLLSFRLPLLRRQSAAEKAA